VTKQRAGLRVSIVPAAIAQVQVKSVRYLDVQGAKMRARLALGWREGDASVVLGNRVGLLVNGRRRDIEYQVSVARFDHTHAALEFDDIGGRCEVRITAAVLRALQQTA